MNNVTLTIGGRNYTVACAPGEEAHILDLGDMIREKLATLGKFGGQSEPRNLLFAALLLADEVHEARSRVEPGQTPEESAAEDDSLMQSLTIIAQKLENLATRLEGSGATS